MFSKQCMWLFVCLSLTISVSDAAASCFSLPSPPVDPAGVAAFTVSDCYDSADLTSALSSMPPIGFPTGTTCKVDVSCPNSDGGGLSYSTCLEHAVTGEGYWTQPVCHVSIPKSFTATLSSPAVTVVAATEYASAIHLSNSSYTTVTSVRIPYDTSIPTAASLVYVRFYAFQEPTGETAGPGDLLYTAMGTVPDLTDTTTVHPVTGVEVGVTGDATTGVLSVFMPTPINVGTDFFVSIAFATPAGMTINVGSDNGVAQHFFTSTTADHVFGSPVEVTTAQFASVVSAVFVLSYIADGYPCNPTLLTASIGYGQQPGEQQGGNGFDLNEPPMPYLDFTHSSITSAGNLELSFTYPTGIYDSIEYLPWNTSSVFGQPPQVIGNINGCETTFQTVSVSQTGCTSTARVQADFLKLIHQLNSGTNTQCGWVQSPNPVQYQGVYYTQWSGRIQIVTYQTVAVLGTTSVRAKAGYAWIVVRSPVVTSSATAAQSIVDQALFKWTIVSQDLKTDAGIPFNSSTVLTTQVTAGYELYVDKPARVTSNSRTPWFFDSFNFVSASGCSGTSTPCLQTWKLSVSQKDASVCSLDATASITFWARCNADLVSGNGCNPNLEQQFNITMFLSSVDFCKVVGGVTSLTVTDLVVAQPTTSQATSITAATNGAGATPPLFAVGGSLGVYFKVQSSPAIPLTLTAVSAKLYETNDRSHSTSYSDVTSISAPFFYAVLSSGGTSTAFFNVPTGDNTVWLQQQTGAVHAVQLSVTATVTYDATSLGGAPEVVVLDLPIALPRPNPHKQQALQALHSSKFRALAAAAAVRTEGLQSGGITAETQTFAVLGDGSKASSAGMSAGEIAGITIGAIAALALIIIGLVWLLSGKAAGYAAPAVAAAAVAPAPAAAPAAAPRILVAGTA